jgi:DNA-binding NtrC family response regulator
MIPPLLGPHLAELRALLPELATGTGPLLLTGEEGVGKSLFAKHLHAQSADRGAPLPLVNLLVSSEREGRLELLGSDFSKLTSTKRSLLEHPGIVLIQHLDAASLPLQRTLAGALKSGRFLRPGSVKPLLISSRVVFTLRSSPHELLSRGTLCQEVYEVLSSASCVEIPPLRQRPGDTSAIARDALGRDLTGELEALLLAQPWPRNVKQLKACLICIRPFTGRGAVPDDCLLEIAQMLLAINEGSELSLKESISRIEGALIARALQQTGGHQAQAARLLGVSAGTLRWYIEKFSLRA